MPIVSVRIPQIGEGLQEARLVAVLKQPGEKVRRDEPIYQMETDKAVMDVESPYEGVLAEWLAPVDTILPIGGEVAKMEVADGVEEAPAPHGAPSATLATAVVETAEAPVSAAASRNANIPPRTRAYAKEKGVSDADLEKLAAGSAKLMPADIDAFLATRSNAAYEETELSSKQKVLNSRMVRGNALVVPGTISCAIDFEPILAWREKVKAGGGDFQPSVFTAFAYAVAKVLKEYPAFRSTLHQDVTLRTYRHVALGIAVSLPGDDLALAVVEDADTLSWEDFAGRARTRIDEARGGKDQANEAVTISLTNMQAFGLRDAVPVVVPPSVATVFLGEIYRGLDPESETPKTKRFANIAITFDHRVANGVGAASFMKAVKHAVETIKQTLGQ